MTVRERLATYRQPVDRHACCPMGQWAQLTRPLPC